MNGLPLLSIITSIYNGGENLKRFLQSISNQTYENIEVVLVEDCSTDELTKKIVSDLESGILAFNKSFKLIRNEKNLGLIESFQKGLDAASGDYFAFPESDDYMDLDFYEIAMNVAITKNVDIVKGLLLKHFDVNKEHVIENFSKTKENTIIPIKDDKNIIMFYIISDFAYSFYHVFSKTFLYNQDIKKLDFKNALLYGSYSNNFYNYIEGTVALSKHSFYHFHIHTDKKFNNNERLKLLTQTTPLLEKMLEDNNNAINDILKEDK